MYWTTEFCYISQYKYTNSNQHGARYKKLRQKQLPIANLSYKRTDTDGMKNLILLSHTLNAPVRYDFEEQEAFIKLVSQELLEENT